MTLSERMFDAITEQIKWEFYSAYLYLSMAAFFEARPMEGMARWMKSQSVEEMVHAFKFYNFVHDRGRMTVLREIPAPPSGWDSPLEVFEEALKHEQEVTRRINELMNLAVEEKDHASQIFLQWFVTEQVEEEASFTAVVEKLRLVQNYPQALFALDRELGARVIDLAPLSLEIAGAAT
ncbi:ferritin [Desulfothermobacter acidiphilus]|uniref:ferritin n=1 Tax=Desulfothermobacter acidiphilus TaxID=1938353 RepID=UPI003F8C9D64